MSKERELLNRSRYNLDREYCADLIDEIQELLAQPEQKREPLSEEFLKEKLKPLSDQEIYSLDEKSNQPFDLYNVRECIRWIRKVEKAHGITGVDDE